MTVGQALDTLATIYLATKMEMIQSYILVDN
jgi:hypothetical protein